MSTPALKLTYFDFNGGRGEPIRLALVIGGVPFEDDRVPLGDWPALKPTTPFGSIPVLEVDGRRISQSNGILRYVGRLGGLYPASPFEGACCDEVLDAVEDVMHLMGATLHVTDPEERKVAREALAAGPLAFFLERVDGLLERGAGTYFVEDRLTVADLKVMGWIRWLRSGVLDHIPTDLTDRHAPRLVAHATRVAAHPAIVAYYAARA